MKAARIHEYNAAPILEDIPTPEIGSTEVLVRIAAASLNPLDVKLLDTLGGKTQQNSFGVLRAGGVLVSIVSPPDEALANAHGVTGTFFPHMSDASRLAKVVERIDAGTKILD